VHALIAAYGIFAVTLAAWWQLRRSANLLPHLRRGPSSFHFSPANGVVAWIMMTVTAQTLLTRQFQRSVPRSAASENGQRVRTDRVPLGTHGPAMTRAVPEWDTMPISIPGPLGPTAAQPPGSAPQPVADPPTSPFPAVGPHAGSGDGPADAPTRSALQPAVTRRGSA